MKHTRFVIISSALLMLQACSTLPAGTFTGYGDPESLLDVSSEVVNLSVHDEAAVSSVAEWVEQDQPGRAELYCPPADALCSQAKDVLDLYGVSYESYPSSEYMVALVYERVMTRDCTNRFVDNTINPYNMNHPSFGCSLAVNMAQAVTDKNQFIRPDLLERMDAVKAIQGYRNYLEPPALPEAKGLDESLLQNIDIE